MLRKKNSKYILLYIKQQLILTKLLRCVHRQVKHFIDYQLKLGSEFGTEADISSISPFSE